MKKLEKEAVAKLPDLKTAGVWIFILNSRDATKRFYTGKRHLKDHSGYCTANRLLLGDEVKNNRKIKI